MLSDDIVSLFCLHSIDEANKAKEEAALNPEKAIVAKQVSAVEMTSTTTDAESTTVTA